MATQYARAPEYARPFFQCVADVTVQKMTMTAQSKIRDRSGQSNAQCRMRVNGDALSTAPSTVPRSVVWPTVKPKPLTMIWRWLLSCE